MTIGTRSAAASASKQGKLLPSDPWGPGEFVSSCSLQERATPKSWARRPREST